MEGLTTECIDHREQTTLSLATVGAVSMIRDVSSAVRLLPLRLPATMDGVKVREIVRRIEGDGWYWVRTRGSHHQYRHPRSEAWLQWRGVQEMIWLLAL